MSKYFYKYPYKPMQSCDWLKVKEIFNIHYFENEKDYIFNGEIHDSWNLFYVDSGHISIEFENKSLPVHLKKGHIILVPPNTGYSIAPSNNTKRFNLFRISFNLTNNSLMESFVSNFMFPYSRYRYEIVREIIREAQRSFEYSLNNISFDQFNFSEASPFASHQMIFSHLERLLINLKRESLNDTGIPLGDESLAESLDTVEETIEYLKHHIYDRISLDDISEYLDISKSYLQKMFVTATGKTVMRHLRELRISEAKHMILFDNMSISEISEQLCFSSIHHFSSCFKLIEGMPPTKYYAHIKNIINGSSKMGIDRIPNPSKSE